MRQISQTSYKNRPYPPFQMDSGVKLFCTVLPFFCTASSCTVRRGSRATGQYRPEFRGKTVAALYCLYVTVVCIEPSRVVCDTVVCIEPSRVSALRHFCTVVCTVDCTVSDTREVIEQIDLAVDELQYHISTSCHIAHITEQIELIQKTTSVCQPVRSSGKIVRINCNGRQSVTS